MKSDAFIKFIDSVLSDYFDLAIPDATITDVVEIAIITFFTYQILRWIKNTRAWTLMKGLGVVVAFFVFATLFRMNTILWIGEKLINVAFIAIVVVFQPELRNALEHLGRNNIITKLLPSVLKKSGDIRFNDKTLNDLVLSCMDMGEAKTGALIVIEKDVALGEYIRTGINLDSIVSRQLIINIFEKNTPLHDGAVIIRGDRIVAATCYLPLTQSVAVNKELGTRHRAAIGVSEVSDSLTIIVSEETGDISVAEEGRLIRHLDEDRLKEILYVFQKSKVAEEGGSEND